MDLFNTVRTIADLTTGNGVSAVHRYSCNLSKEEIESIYANKQISITDAEVEQMNRDYTVPEAKFGKNNRTLLLRHSHKKHLMIALGG